MNTRLSVLVLVFFASEYTAESNRLEAGQRSSPIGSLQEPSYRVLPRFSSHSLPEAAPRAAAVRGGSKDYIQNLLGC